MRSWKRLWLKELDEKIPALDERVKNTPVPTATPNEKGSFSVWFATHKKPFFACVASGLAIAVALCVSLPLAFAPTPDKSGAIVLEINPRAVFSLDKEGKITAVVAGNADADTVLVQEERRNAIVGKSAEEGVQVFVDYAFRLGFIDWENGDAVRVTACEDEETASEIGDAVRAYCMEKGALVAVVARTLTTDAFCALAQLPALESAEVVGESVAGISALWYAREAQGKNGEALQELYRSIVSAEEIAGDVGAQVLEKMAQIEEKATFVGRIADINLRILESEDNPGLLGIKLDYWALQEYSSLLPSDSYSAEFQALITEMEGALAEYERAYGQSIENRDELFSVAGDLERVLASVGDLTTAFVQEHLSFLLSLLNSLGVDTSAWSAPDTVESYERKAGAHFVAEYEKRENENRQNYERVRAEIDEEGYRVFVESVVFEYGSLDAYWEILQKK